MLTPDAQRQYTERNAILTKLGFSSYRAYLHSTVWAQIRREVLLPHARCRACGNLATQVHHNRYHLEDMNGKNLTHLIPVCRQCHHKAEFNKAGEKIGPQRATASLDAQRVTLQRIWHRQDVAAAWQHLFKTIEDVRIFLGMEESEEARCLVEQLDEALAALPPKREKNARRKNRHQAA